MRVLVWITPSTWEVCVDHARELLGQRDDAEVTLLHVVDEETVRLAAAPGPGRLGRHRAPPQAAAVSESAQAEARVLLDEAGQRFGRAASVEIRSGRVEHEVARASEDADLLVLGRDGEARRGPKSLGKRSRFVVDHASCDLTLVWATPRKARDARPLPPPPPPRR